MGRENYSAIGIGMTQQEAWDYAIRFDRTENGHQEGYTGTIGSATGEEDKAVCLIEPKPAKKCIVEKTEHKGARKWETVFVISPRFDDPERFEQYKYVEVKTTQGDAINKAKEMALRFGETFKINIEKHLIGQVSRIAIVTPKAAVMGKWKFTGLARC